MLMNPCAFIERSIKDLEGLATLFAEELRQAASAEPLEEHLLRRKEALLTISILLPKLSAVRARNGSSNNGPFWNHCAHCDGE